jgi:hypothetical protein
MKRNERIYIPPRGVHESTGSLLLGVFLVGLSALLVVLGIWWIVR